MSATYDLISVRSETVSTGADKVEWCKTLVNGRPCCCPVIVSPGAMDRHVRRCHIPPAPAAGVNVQRWERI